MPSGPKKRLRAKRKKQGSPATDANSDREMENLSISESIDADDNELGRDTPGKVRPCPTYLDKDALSSQTDEWVRVSDFDVGTPGSPAGIHEPSAEDEDINRVRPSLDKFLEWETIATGNSPERPAGSTNSLEGETSDVKLASGLSSDRDTHLPSPHPERNKDADSFASDRIYRSDSTSSSSPAQLHPPSESISIYVPEIGKDIVSSTILHSAPAEGVEFQTAALIDVSVAHAELTTVLEAKIVTNSAASSEYNETEGTLVCDDSDKPVEEFQLGEELSASSPAEDIITSTPSEEKIITTASTKYIMKENALLYITAEEEFSHDEEEVLRMADQSLLSKDILGQCEELYNDIKTSNLEGKEVDRDEKVNVPTKGDIVDISFEGKEVASTCAEFNSEEIKGSDGCDHEVATFVETKYSKSEELEPDPRLVEELHMSACSEASILVEERYLSISTTPAEDNGVAKEKPLQEVRWFLGCCWVIYWLLGRDY